MNIHSLQSFQSFAWGKALWSPVSFFCRGTIPACFRENNEAWGGTCKCWKPWGQEVSCPVVVHSAQTPRPQGCTCLITYMTVINTLRPVANALGLLWFWGTEKLDSKNTKRFQDSLDRLKTHPLNQGRSAKSNSLHGKDITSLIDLAVLGEENLFLGQGERKEDRKTDIILSFS